MQPRVVDDGQMTLRVTSRPGAFGQAHQISLLSSNFKCLQVPI
jgi:hypothetical protein